MKTIAILATLDTKAAEADFMRQEIERLGGQALILDFGVVGSPGIEADITRSDVMQAGGSTLDEQLQHPSRAKSNPIVTAGATKIMLSTRSRMPPCPLMIVPMSLIPISRLI